MSVKSAHLSTPPRSAALGAPVSATVSFPVTLSLDLPVPAVALFVSVPLPLLFPFPLLFFLALLLPFTVTPLSFPLSFFFALPPFPLELQPLLLPLVFLLF